MEVKISESYYYKYTGNMHEFMQKHQLNSAYVMDVLKTE